jgi:hypothetical protein
MRTLRYFALVSLTCLSCGEAAAQAVHGGICRPVSERDQEVGCWILSNDPIGELAGNQVFWHLDDFATREAAEAAKGRHSTVLQALGTIWLLTIGDADWRASGGQHVSTIGPLPITPVPMPPNTGRRCLHLERRPRRTLIQVLKPGTRSPARHA